MAIARPLEWRSDWTGLPHWLANGALGRGHVPASFATARRVTAYPAGALAPRPGRTPARAGQGGSDTCTSCNRVICPETGTWEAATLLDVPDERTNRGITMKS